MRVPPEEKRALLIRANAVLHEYADEIREFTMREIGATRSKAQFEIDFCSDEFLEAASYPTQHHGALLADRANRKSYAVRIPYGVVASITPSNVPLLLAARVIAPALATGNAVLVKPIRVQKSAVVSSSPEFLKRLGYPLDCYTSFQLAAKTLKLSRPIRISQ